jgi:predicted transcriptional regulator
MPNMLRFPDLTLGDLEREVLETLWADGPQNPVVVHERIGLARDISINTVSSALKRLYEKGLLDREKVSHAYVYRAIVTRAELQRDLIGALVNQFGQPSGSSFLAAFVDVAEAQGRGTLRELEKMITTRLAQRRSR